MGGYIPSIYASWTVNLVKRALGASNRTHFRWSPIRLLMRAMYSYVRTAEKYVQPAITPNRVSFPQINVDR